LDAVLKRIKRARATIKLKFKWYILRLYIIGFVTNANRKWLDTAKIIKIIKWGLCKDETNAYIFLGIAIFY
jgi:hypothetical protein